MEDNSFNKSTMKNKKRTRIPHF